VEIENFLMSHHKVFDAGVIGIPDNRLGEVVAAIISPKTGQNISEDEIRLFGAAPL
jgi:acyl-CoA synthetase (AMP-forming)/AMP-acid ligase II